MDVVEDPVAFNTRSRQRKRKAPLKKGLTVGVSGGAAATSETDSPPTKRSPRSDLACEPGSGVKVSDNKLTLSPNGNQVRTQKENISPQVKVPGMSALNEKSSQAAAVTATTKENSENKGDDRTEIIVLNKDELTVVEDVANVTVEIVRLMKSEDWLDNFDATTLVRRVVVLHSDVAVYSFGSILGDILLLLKNGVNSLRSAQSRNSLFAIREMFQLYPEKRELAVEPQGLVDAVLLKSINDKRFIASAGNAVLGHMVKNAPFFSILGALLSQASSKSPKLCAVIAKHSECCLRAILSNDEAQLLKAHAGQVAEDTIKGFANLALSRSVDAKKIALSALQRLRNHVGKDRFQACLEAMLSPTDAAKLTEELGKSATKRGPTKKLSIKEMMAKKRLEMKANSAPPSSSTNTL